MSQTGIALSSEAVTPSAVGRYIEGLRGAQTDTGLRLDRYGQVVSRFFQCDIGSVFQPIVTTTPGPVLAWQAFARIAGAHDADLSPWRLFTRAASDEELVAADRRCRLLHALNFFPRTARSGHIDCLHLCVHDRLLSAVASNHGGAFRRVLDTLEIDGQRVVIELPRLPVGNEYVLAYVAANYRLNGFRVAINPVSVAQLESLLNRLRADAVKLDSAVFFPNAGVVAPAWLRQTAETGAMIVATKVENVLLQDRVTAAGVTHVQGFWAGEPRRTPVLG